jgi:CRP-like cAMP-binding protein/2-polyprenyl-6-methoxyphenol hydroxylase-like FAD-dependent oxidoreductase
MSLFDVLQRNPHFENLSNDELNQLASVMLLSKHADGHVFIREGEVGDTIFLVIEGTIAVTLLVADREQIIQTLNAGDFFGLLALIDDAPRKATCRAQGDVVVASLNRSSYEELVGDSARTALAFQRALGHQVASDFRNVTQQIHDLLYTAIETHPNDIDVDVAVIGSGPLGMFYAMWVKRFRPETNVLLIDRRSHPVYKIGESTLSTTVRAFSAMGLTLPVMRRLFGNKAGLRWFHTQQNSDALDGHFDIIDIEETYQVERRVLETALQYLMRKNEDLRILNGVQVRVRNSQLNDEIKELLCTDTEGNEFTVRARVVCDASGAASVLPRYFDVYRKAPEAHDTFSYNSYFAYFRPKKKVPIDFWEYPATRHICFREGWLWFISLISWESTPQDKLEAMIQYLLDRPHESDADLPPREALAAQFGATYESVFSIGFTIRTDRDVDGMSIEERFNHWVNQYPAIRWVLDHFELIEAPYEGKHRGHFAFMDMLHDAEYAAGDGWCAVGDAAMFINPFFSLGLNYGTGTAYMAARDTAAALTKGDVSKSAFQKYQEYVNAIFEQKVRETDMYYRAFDHPVSYERVLALTIANGILDVLPRDGYSASDPYVFDPLNPKWVAVTKQIVQVQRDGEKRGDDPAQTAKVVKQIVDDYIAMLRATTSLNDVPLSHYTRFYDDMGNRLDSPSFHKGHGDYEAILCNNCALYFDDSLTACPYCGEPKP